MYLTHKPDEPLKSEGVEQKGGRFFGAPLRPSGRIVLSQGRARMTASAIMFTG
jgi:hypothetical protein